MRTIQRHQPGAPVVATGTPAADERVTLHRPTASAQDDATTASAGLGGVFQTAIGCSCCSRCTRSSILSSCAGRWLLLTS